MDHKKVAALIIGDELLRGDIQDQNMAYLAKWLFMRSYTLQKVIFVKDVAEDIITELQRLKSNYNYVFTSGGIGPTHDDITIDTVAKACNVPVVTDPTLEKMIKEHYGERANPARLRMARVPQGSQVVLGAFRWVPVIKIDNILVLPGVPALFRSCVDNMANEFPGKEMPSETILLQASEGDIATQLTHIQEQHPQVLIGSYPLLEQQPIVKLRLTADTEILLEQASRQVKQEFQAYLITDY